MIYYVRILWYSYFISFNFIWFFPIVWKSVKSEAKPSSWSFSGFAWELARGVTRMDQILLVSPCSTLSSAKADPWQYLQTPCSMHVSMVSGIRYYVVCADLSTTLSLSLYIYIMITVYLQGKPGAGTALCRVSQFKTAQCKYLRMCRKARASTSWGPLRMCMYVYII